jgi:hypothetical protein
MGYRGAIDIVVGMIRGKRAHTLDGLRQIVDSVAFRYGEPGLIQILPQSIEDKAESSFLFAGADTTHPDAGDFEDENITGLLTVLRGSIVEPPLEVPR